MRILSVICFATYFVCCGSLTRYISHIQNFVNLVSAYNLDGYSTIDFPPLADVSQAMVVNIDMHLYAVNGFDEVAGNIELVIALEMNWLDEMSIIQSISFKIEDRAEFLVPFDMIWTPKIVLTNAIGATSDVGDNAYLCRFDMSSKRISWKPRVVVSGSCTPDVTFYPFDKQECDFVYTAWGFKADEILLETSTDSWNLAEYDLSGEWDIDSTSTTPYIQNGQSYIKFTIVMVRKPLYFAFNILLPILVLCLLNSTVFLLPAESGERVGFSVTCFLSFMVLLNMIMDIMPRSSNPISFLCYYLVVMMSNSGAMTLVTILLMRVYHKPEKSVVPKWMQRAVTFVNCGCAKLRCCVLCCRYLRKKCCCEDQRKCGCKRRRKTKSEESLVEITVDKNKNIVEKEVKKKSKDLNNEDQTETSKCCDLSCVKRPQNSENNCCCGIIIGCKRCKSASDETVSKNTASCEKAKPSSYFEYFRRKKRKMLDGSEEERKAAQTNSCFHFLRKRRLEDGKETVTIDNDSPCNKKIRSDEIDSIQNSAKCFRFFKTSDGRDYNDRSEMANEIRNRNKVDKKNENKPKNEKQISCLEIPKKETEIESKHDKSSKGCFPYCGKTPVKKTTDETKENVGKENSLQDKNTEARDCHKVSCLAFMRKRKVSTVHDIDADILPVSVRSEDSKTLKVSFKGKVNLDNEETLLQRWEDATKSTTNKKGNSLDPINNEDTGNRNETKVEILQDCEESEFTVKTKSIRATNLLNEVKTKEHTVDEAGHKEDDLELEIVRKEKSLKSSIKEKKEKMPKPIVHEQVIIPQKRKQSIASKKNEVIEDDSEESDVDSLADLEEEVSWPEVGRILDTFFFLAFSGGQAFLTVVFLVPLFTGDTKSSES